ncbi:MAG TPA: hypothetical protein VMT74_07465 [Gaiellaceae bacterium]|nr:hypothetical protein [Gaiellaceae bacterium]
MGNADVRLEEIDRRLDEVWEHAGIGVVGAKPRIQRHLDRLRQKEVLALAAVQETYEESWQALAEYGRAVDHTFRLVELELELADAASAAGIAEDAAAFTDALAAELDGWDLYVERLQVWAASLADAKRSDAEETLRELRRYRNALAQVLAECRTAPDDWRALRAAAAVVRRELEHAIDETAIKFA